MRKLLATAISSALVLTSLLVAAPASARVAHSVGEYCPTVTSTGSAAGPKVGVVGSRTSTQGIRATLGWSGGYACYEVQYSTSANFTSNVKTLERYSPANKPTDSEFGLTLTGLPNNTLFYIRARQITNAGVATKWSASAKEATESRAPLDVKVKWSHTSTGHVKITWTHNGAYTTHQRVHIATSSFDSGKKGTKHQIINVPRSARSYTLTDSDLAKLNTPVNSGRVIRFRVEARNQGPNPVRTKFSTGHTPSAIVGQAKNSAPKEATTVVVASYNVTSAAANPKNKQWKNRRTHVAAQIVNSKAGIVGLQEAITLKQGSSTQIKQLLSDVKKQQAKKNKKVKWKLVRDTRYIKRGKAGGNDGQRIMYDSAKYKLVSKCSNKTGKGKNSDYSMSCVVKLPRVGSASSQKFASYAQFQDRATKKKFWVVSVHLEHRKGAKYDKNRMKQMSTVLKRIDKVNKKNEPVLMLGDLNSSNKRDTSLATIDSVLRTGFVDAASAKQTKDVAYHTYNDWKKQKASASKFGSRIDFIMGKGRDLHFSQYTTVKNGYKASDHNLVKATVKFSQ